MYICIRTQYIELYRLHFQIHILKLFLFSLFIHILKHFLCSIFVHIISYLYVPYTNIFKVISLFHIRAISWLF